MKNVIGIDPGAHGAVAFINDDSVSVYNTAHMPPIEALRCVLETVDVSVCVAYLERIGGFIAGKSLPGSAMFKMGHSAGYWEGALAALKIRTILVRPQQWQAGIPGVTAHKEKPARKRALKDEAIRRFPALKITLDNCDALLIADYGRTMERGEPQFSDTCRTSTSQPSAET